MKNLKNTLIAVLFLIAFVGYGFCSFFIEPGIDNSFETFSEDNGKINNVTVPAVIYHLVVSDKSMSGEFVITPEEFENDVLYIKKMGFTPIFVSEVISYSKGDGVLPEKPVLLTFDDGYYNNYLNVFPIIKKHGIKINISLIGKYTEKYSESGEISEIYSHITYDQINEMAQTGLVEFGNHTYDLHNINTFRRGILKGVGEDEEKYKKVIEEDFLKNHNIIKEKCNVEMKFFTYPYGFSSKEADEVIKKTGYEAVLTCKEENNLIANNKDSLLKINRYNRSSGKMIEKIIQ